MRPGPLSFFGSWDRPAIWASSLPAVRQRPVESAMRVTVTRGYNSSRAKRKKGLLAQLKDRVLELGAGRKAGSSSWPTVPKPVLNPLSLDSVPNVSQTILTVEESLEGRFKELSI